MEGGRKELTVIHGFGDGKLLEKILVDATKDVTTGCLKGLAIKNLKEFLQYLPVRKRCGSPLAGRYAAARRTPQ